MFGRRRTPPHNLSVHIASTDSSPRASISYDDTHDGAPAMGDDFAAAARPLSVAIPKSFAAMGPYCVRRPNLSEILANESSPPWTLSAFMAYLSQNHCLETLEFTMDASRYGKHYAKMAGRIPGGVMMPSSEEAVYLKMLWQRLMDAYIAPNGPREVNLPAELRNELLSLVDALGGPPAPNTLDNAVQHIYTLMEESVLLPFLNSYGQTTASEYSVSAENLVTQRQPHTAHPAMSQSFEERGFHRPHRKSSPQGQPHLSPLSPAVSNSSSIRASAPSTLSSLSRGLSVRQHRSSSNPGTRNVVDSKSPTPQSADSEMTDDLISTTSTMTSHSLSHGSAGSVGLHTPPTTPPMADCQPYAGDAFSPASTTMNSPTEPHSPREAAWKRGMSKLGLRKSNRSRVSGTGSQCSVVEE